MLSVHRSVSGDREALLGRAQTRTLTDQPSSSEMYAYRRAREPGGAGNPRRTEGTVLLQPREVTRRPSRGATQRPCGAWLVVMIVFAPTLGCGESGPFDLAPVHGTVTYSDGSPIKADQLVVKFVPKTFQMQGKVASRSATTYVDVADGSFSKPTTWKYGDGVMVGRHKVVVIALSGAGPDTGSPTKAVPSRYHRAETTPLEVEVSAAGDNDFSLKVERGQ